MVTDKELLKVYMKGFNDELLGIFPTKFDNPLKQSAYHWGKLDTIIGDDVSSSDNQTEKSILNKIKNEKIGSY